MTDQTTCMADLIAIFSSLERWGPGSEADTLRALQQVTGEPLRLAPRRIADIGWDNYYQHIKARIAELQGLMPDSAALSDIAREVALADKATGVFGYEVFVVGQR
jgi:hypothetical protein